jgi:SAM-dependent methyltransferase
MFNVHPDSRAQPACRFGRDFDRLRPRVRVPLAVGARTKMSILKKIVGKRDSNPPAPLPEQLPSPVQVRRRHYRGDDVRKRGGVPVFDTPEALALNAARMDHLASLGLALSGKRVLDLGCGVGHLGDRLQQMGCSVVCVDGRAQNIESLRARYPKLEAHVGDVEQDLSRFGKFDVVFSYGLLYHLENPLQALRNMAAVCDELLLLETMICDHTLPLVRVEDESTDFNQALAGLAVRPTPHYVVLGLNRAGFEHVYAPATPPAHEDFRFEWKSDFANVRDGHPLRCVFVASRHELRQASLVSLLTD